MEPLSFILPLLLLALCGVGIGILSGMFGIGGGTIMVPLLHLCFGLPMLNASASSLLTVVPTSISGSLRHLRRRTVKVESALAFGIPGACASFFTAFISGSLPDLAILVATVAVLAFCAVRVFREAAKKPLDEQGHTSKNRFHSKRNSLLASLVIGLIAGAIAGIVGVGGGFILVPLGISLFGYSMKEMSAISLLAVAIIAIPGALAHAIFGHIWYLQSLALMVGSIPGASLGVWLLPRVPERGLRIAYGFLLVVSGIILISSRVLLGR
jgi:uncharacterized membrane protein YfcA